MLIEANRLPEDMLCNSKYPIGWPHKLCNATLLQLAARGSEPAGNYLDRTESDVENCSWIGVLYC